MYRIALLALLLSEPLQFRIEGPPELASVRARLESIDPQHFADIATLVGMPDSGAPIRVVLATENSDLARTAPPWVSGFAVGRSDLAVIFPARSPSYPDNTVEDVLRHEAAHVLIWRASAGRPVPRWFDEGLAMSAERERLIQDQTQVLYQLLTGSRTNLEELNRLFLGGQNDQIRAYALAGALVHDVLHQYGRTVCSEILKRVRGGASFDTAFEQATGSTPGTMEAEFWRRQRIWTMWVPVMASPTTLWLVVTVIAFLAIYMHRRRNRQIEDRWAREEGQEEGEDGDHEDQEEPPAS